MAVAGRHRRRPRRPPRRCPAAPPPAGDPGRRRGRASRCWCARSRCAPRSSLTTSPRRGWATAQLAAHQVVLTCGACWRSPSMPSPSPGRPSPAGASAPETSWGTRGHAPMVQWGLGAGVVLGLLLAPAGPCWARLFSADPAVRVAPSRRPLRGRGRHAAARRVGLRPGRRPHRRRRRPLPRRAPASSRSPCTRPGRPARRAHRRPGTPRLVPLWVAFAGGYLALRAVFLGLRARADAWLVTGAAPLTPPSTDYRIVTSDPTSTAAARPHRECGPSGPAR